jgi:hypothetical protein
MTLICIAIALALTAKINPTTVATQHQSRPVANLGEKEAWPLKLQDAVQIALDNSELACVIRFGEQSTPVGNRFYPLEKTQQPRERPAFVDAHSIVIKQVDRDECSFRFRVAALALLRSVEQQYWGLAQASGALSAANEAVKLANKIVSAEQADLAQVHGSAVNLAERADHLKRFERILNDRTLDAVAAERRFREILGLPGADGRRIIPVTPPIEAQMTFVWASCLDAVLTKGHNPLRLTPFCLALPKNVIEGLNKFQDTSHKRQSDSEDELSIAMWVEESVSSRPPTACWSCGDPWPTRGCQILLRRPAQQPPATFAKAVADVERSYQWYSKANRSRVAAEHRLESQRREWRIGTIPADRYLETLEEFAVLAERESRQCAAYNSAIASLSERNGTLLAEHNIIIFAD